VARYGKRTSASPGARGAGVERRHVGVELGAGRDENGQLQRYLASCPFAIDPSPRSMCPTALEGVAGPEVACQYPSGHYLTATPSAPPSSGNAQHGLHTLTARARAVVHRGRAYNRTPAGERTTPSADRQANVDTEVLPPAALGARVRREVPVRLMMRKFPGSFSVTFSGTAGHGGFGQFRRNLSLRPVPAQHRAGLWCVAWPRPTFQRAAAAPSNMARALRRARGTA